MKISSNKKRNNEAMKQCFNQNGSVTRVLPYKDRIVDSALIWENMDL